VVFYKGTAPMQHSHKAPAIVTGETLERELSRAMAKRQQKQEVDEYNEYERRACGYMVKREAMPASELSDPCYFQCRACGWNPHEPQIRRWFWARSITSRRDLVTLSRKIRVTFFRG
jgi:hypothetical protein